MPLAWRIALAVLISPAAMLPFVDYIERLSPIMAIAELWEEFRRNGLPAWFPLPLLAATFHIGIPLALWFTRLCLPWTLRPVETCIAVACGLLGAVPIAVILVSLLLKEPGREAIIFLCSPGAVLLVGAWIAWRLRKDPEAIGSVAMLAPYAANLLLSTLLFHAFQSPGFLTRIGTIGWWIGLLVLAACLAQMFYLLVKACHYHR